MNDEGIEVSFRLADEKDESSILALYDDVRDSEYSTWTAGYPIDEDIECDISHDCLYVYEENGSITGTLSVVCENELEHLDFWQIKEANVRELSRIAVAGHRQGHGICREMVSLAEKLLRAQGAAAIHLLAAEKNVPAVKAYERCGFVRAGECDEWGSHYIAFEKILNSGDN